MLLLCVFGGTGYCVMVLRFCSLTLVKIKGDIMKSTFSRMAAVVLTVWLGLSAGTANASLVTFNAPGWDYSTPGVASATWGVSGLDKNISYSDWIHFSLPGGSTGFGGAIESAIKVIGTGVIDSFVLWRTDSSWNHIGSAVASGGTGGAFSYFNFHTNYVPGYFSLETTVHNASAYSGSIATPVPEPEMFAMLLAGLGLLGFSARRRNNNT